MEEEIIDFEEFELHFLTASNEDNEDDEEEMDNDEIKENMESKIPVQTIFLGSIETDVENWTSWSVQDSYYIHPLTNEQFDWALFRITWDDNWGRWEWSFDTRLKGHVGNYKEAARTMIDKLWKKWNIDLNDSDYKVFREFIKEI
jgi:hypothetical protein